MPRLRRLAAFAGLLLFLTSCALYHLVPPGPTVIGDVLVVEPGIAWNRLEDRMVKGPTALWTIDGESLHTLSFYATVADGGRLASAPTGSDVQLPAFRSGMTPIEIADVIAGTVARMTKRSVFNVQEIRAERFAGLDGFRIAFTFTGPDEIDRQGIAVGAVDAAGLHLIIYQGSRLYHFGQYQAEVERIIASAQLTGRP